MKILKRILKWLFIILLTVIIYVMAVNFYVILSTKDQILSIEKLQNNDIDAIVVLGTSVINKEPGVILQERIDMAIELYENNVSDKIIMSGDNSTEFYDEVTAMKNYAIDNGIPEENIYIDPSGLSTYDSIYRIKELFSLNKIIIVTQEYHLYRALNIANALDIDSYGISFGNSKVDLEKEVREILARNKDFILGIIKPEPTVVNDAIDELNNTINRIN